MINNVKTYIIFLLPLFLKYFFLLLLGDYKLFFFGDLLEDILFSVIIFFALTISDKRFYVVSVLAIFIFYFVLEGASYLAVSSNFTSSFMYVLIESSKGELQEFFHSYISSGILFFIVLMVLSFFILKRNHFKNKLINVYGAIVVILVLTVILKLTGLIERNAYHNLVRGGYGYYQLQNGFKLNKYIRKENIEIRKDNDVLVIILGESTTRNHMGLYGYFRETTPYLSAFKDSLFVYSDVISTDVITTKSLPKMLTSLSNELNDTIQNSLIDIFNTVGYKTYWLSNQRPIGYYDNRISEIASQSNYLKFFNHIDEVNTMSFDEVVMSDYNRILNDPNEKKVIFIRLIGTHFDYKNRYPLAFNEFRSNTNSEKLNIINQYDNAVTYNDHIVYSILKDLKKIKGKNALIYLSDHGENVFDGNDDFFGRTEANLTKGMFDIPFIIWTSKSFEFPDDFKYVPNRKFMADHLYESVTHLFGVKYKEMDFTKSIFSNTFKERKRIVVGGINYDEYFVKKNE